MRKVLLVILISLLFPICFAGAVSAGEKKVQMVEILNHEITVLKNLMANLSNALQQPTEFSAKAYLALNIEDNNILFEKNINEPHSIASITKLMNAVVAAENIDPNKTITISSAMLKPEGRSPAIYKGLNISAKNLMKASLTQSVNDAAESLSYFLGKKTFVAKMNQKAKDLGMNDTVFVDANGLNPANKSTASDLAKLVAYVYQKYPQLLATTKENNFWLPDNMGKLVKFYNENYFYYLPKFIGGKTGYLPEAKQNLAALFSLQGKPVAIIILNSDNTVFDALKMVTNIEKNF